MNKQRMLWLAFGTTAAIAAGLVARRGVAAAWRRSLGAEPPTDIDDPGTGWRGLLLWAAVSGFCVAFARVLGFGAANRAWHWLLRRDSSARPR